MLILFYCRCSQPGSVVSPLVSHLTKHCTLWIWVYTETGLGLSAKHGNFPVVTRPCKHVAVNFEIRPPNVEKCDYSWGLNVLVSLKSSNSSNVAVVYHLYRQKKKIAGMNRGYDIYVYAVCTTGFTGVKKRHVLELNQLVLCSITHFNIFWDMIGGMEEVQDFVVLSWQSLICCSVVSIVSKPNKTVVQLCT